MSASFCNRSLPGIVIGIITSATLASEGISCRHVSVCPSVTSRYSTETAKHRIMQTTPHDSPRTFLKSRQNSNGITPNGGAKCRWGKLNAFAVAKYWRLLTRSVVNLVRSHVYHTYHIICLQRVRSDAARRAGSSGTADPCFSFSYVSNHW